MNSQMVYLLIPVISATSRTVRRQSQSMPSCADFKFSVILILQPHTRRISHATVDKITLSMTCMCSGDFNWENVSIDVNPDGKQT